MSDNSDFYGWPPPGYYYPHPYYYPHQHYTPAPQVGWKCPECGRINAPHVSTCPCSVKLRLDGDTKEAK